MAKRYLKNRLTGVVFPYNERLARLNRNMEPCDKDGRSFFQTVDADEVEEPRTGEPVEGDAEAQSTDHTESPNQGQAVADNGGIVVSRATKAELLQYAQEQYGIQLEDSLTVAELRKQVTALIKGE